MAHAGSDRAPIEYRSVSLAAGDHDGTGTAPAGVALLAPGGVREYTDPFGRPPVSRSYVQGAWTSPEITPDSNFAGGDQRGTFAELVATWHARTPGASWIEVAARARSVRTHEWSRFLTLARWADHDTSIHPTSVPDESCDIAAVATDTLRIPGGADAWQLRTTLLRPATESLAADPLADASLADASLAGDPVDGPVLTYAGVLTSGPTQTATATSAAGPGAGHMLDVPTLSQRIHAGHYPEWGGGGEVWCSPTSVAMVLAYWGTGPDRDALSWVPADYPDRPVYHAVRHCWDHAYRGAGNWSFNAAYAARFGLRTFVTRLRDLTEAEAFIRGGVPLVASLRVNPADLSGAEYTSNGHLLVITGFTDGGDVVVNDPAARDLATLRRVYRRHELEHAWRGGSGGVVYIIHPSSVELPPRPAQPNWNW